MLVDDGDQQVVDAGGEPGDLCVEGVDLVEQHPGQLGVMIVEPAGERLDEGGVLGLHRAAGQTGKPPRVTFARDQCLQHVAHR